MILIQRSVLIAVLLIILAPSSSVFAQEIPEDKLATFVFDIRADRIMENEFVKELGAETLAEVIDLGPIMPPGATIRDLVRFNGAYSLTQNIYLFGGPEDLGEFHFQLHFRNEEVIKSIKEELLKNFTESTEKNGRKLYSRDSDLYIYFEGNMLEAGSKLYLEHPDREFLTPQLAEHWARLPEVGAKAAFDLEASKEGLIAMRAELVNNSPIESILTTVIDQVLDNVTLASFFVDLENETMLSLTMVTNDQKKSETIKGVADGLTFMAALPLKNLFQYVPTESEEAKAMLNGMAEQLKAKVIEGGVAIEVKKPDGFEEIFRRDVLPGLKELIRVQQISENLREVGRGIRFAFNNDTLVFDNSAVEGWSDQLSWRARLLNALYRFDAYSLRSKVDLTASWNDEANQELIGKMPRQLGNNGHNSDLVWVRSSVTSFDDVVDGIYETIAILKLPQPTENEWTNPEGDSISMLAAIKLVKGLEDGQKIHAVTYSGRIIMLSNKLSHNQLKAYFSPDAGDSPRNSP